MTVPKYLEIFRQTVRELERHGLGDISDRTENQHEAKAEIDPRVCAQCHAGPSIYAVTDAPTLQVKDRNGEAFWVHPECEPFWLEEHMGIPRNKRLH